ncbi:BRO family protein [Roseomonas sp. TAS13]|uniref:BRO-N domain-containing protein n=1 Tax=Roseomonas sp. TAS13 TaxID=1926319 RepID=UPI00096A4E65
MRCFISEAGLYRLIMRAQTERPEVASFQQWVTRDVLPAIRKDGAYVMGEEKALAAPDRHPCVQP